MHARQKLSDWTCHDCGHCWHPESVEAIPEPAATVLQGPAIPDLARLPYPVALTANRLARAIEARRDVLKTLFALKDCFEAAIKYCGVMLLAEYFRSPACTAEHNAALLEKMVRPSLGVWVDQVVGDLSHWLMASEPTVGPPVAWVFAQPPRQKGGKTQATSLLERCKQFVSYRNDALGHGAMRSDRTYTADLADWLPLVGQLLGAVAGLGPWRLYLVINVDRCRLWMGPSPAKADEPGSFRREHAGHFILRGLQPLPPTVRVGLEEARAEGVWDLYPFLCYLPDAQQQQRLHFYDSIYRYQETRKEVQVLEYDEGFKHNDESPVAGLEEVFTTELLNAAFKRHQGRMEVIEGRVANFGELIAEHAEIVGRRFAIDDVKRFIAEHDRGLLVIEAEPGKGKTALMAHLIEHVFGHFSPPAVHFFYRRTAGITDPDVCVKSLYVSLLEAHNITETEESKRRNSPEETYSKLVNLLAEQIAPRLSPQRPQLIFVDALDEAELTPAGRSAFQRLPENLPAGVYIIASTRPVVDRALLTRRPHLCWYNLDDPQLLQANLSDGAEYVQRELAQSALPNATLDEVARAGRGNFLVLKLLCGHVRTRLEPGEVGSFLRRLLTGGAKDQLGFIYEEFWNRLTARLGRADTSLLGDVAGLLVTARARLSAEVVCGCLKLCAGDWDFALRHLAEYLTVVVQEEEGEQEAYYRIYHESFADFLRVKLASDRPRYENLLADYCLMWSRLAGGRGRLYALRFGPSHLLATGRWRELESLLTDLVFLEARNAAGMVFELAGDFSTVVKALPEDRPQYRILRLLEEALRRDIHFIARHAQDYPQGLFQCLWNSCWWYDCDDAAVHFLKGCAPGLLSPTSGKGADGAGNSSPLPRGDGLGVGDSSPVPGPVAASEIPDDQRLSRLLQRWRKQKDEAERGFPWLRALRPPPMHLGTAQQAVLRGHDKGVTSVAFSPSGDRIVSGSKDNTVRLWDARTGEELAILRGHEDHVTSVVFSPGGERIVSGSNDKTVRLWDARSGAELAVLRGHEDHVTSVAFSPDGERIVSGSNDETVRVWDAASSAELLVLRGHEERVQSVALSPGGERIVSGGGNSVRVWDVRSGKELSALYECYDTMAFSRDGERIVSVGANSLLVWDVRSGKELAILPGHGGFVKSVAFSPDRAQIVSGQGYHNATVRVWDAQSGAELAVLRGHEDSVRSVAFSPSGDRIVSGSEDNTVRVWDACGGAELTVLCGHEQDVTGVAFSPKGHWVVSGSHDKTVRLWDACRGEERGVLRRHKTWVQSVAFSAKGDQLASGSGDVFGDGEVCVWDAHSGEELAVFHGHEDEVNSVAFSPGGERIVSGSNDNAVRVGDIQSGVESVVLRGHARKRGHDDSKVNRVAFSAGGDRIVSESSDQTVRVWDARSGQCLEVIPSSGDAWAIATGSRGFPLRVLPRGLETVVERADSGKSVAWFPENLKSIATHPSGRTWAGAVASYLCLFTLECGEMPAAKGLEELNPTKRGPDPFSFDEDEDIREEEPKPAKPSAPPMTFAEHVKELVDLVWIVPFAWVATTVVLAIVAESTGWGSLLTTPACSLALVYPLLCLQLWKFVRPGLARKERWLAVLGMGVTPVVVTGLACVLWPIDWLWTRLLGDVPGTTYSFLIAKVELIIAVILAGGIAALSKSDSRFSSRRLLVWMVRGVLAAGLILLLAPAVISAAILAAAEVPAVIAVAARLRRSDKRTGH